MIEGKYNVIYDTSYPSCTLTLTDDNLNLTYGDQPDNIIFSEPLEKISLGSIRDYNDIYENTQYTTINLHSNLGVKIRVHDDVHGTGEFTITFSRLMVIDYFIKTLYDKGINYFIDHTKRKRDHLGRPIVNNDFKACDITNPADIIFPEPLLEFEAIKTGHRMMSRSHNRKFKLYNTNFGSNKYLYYADIKSNRPPTHGTNKVIIKY
jgi:hypothetical protein